MKINLSDSGFHLSCAPLSLTRPIGSLRCGVFTNSERWNFIFPEAQIGFETQDYLSSKFKAVDDAIVINGSVIPNAELAAAILHLEENSTLFLGEETLAKKGNGHQIIQYIGNKPLQFKNWWNLLSLNGDAIKNDFELLRVSTHSNDLSSSNSVIGSSEWIIVEDGARIEGCIFNTNDGPIYIGKGVEIMEGTCIRGPFAACENSVVKMGSKIYGPTTIGPYSKVGGELNNVIFQSYSNKAHDGFLGNSCIGEWCNLGADSNNSNLKNNYGLVSIYDYAAKDMISTGLQFLGLCMGDHSKCGINTMFNTGTIIGVSCNLFGPGFFPKHIPSFSWGETDNLVRYKMDKAVEHSNKMMERRNTKLQKEDLDILQAIQD